MTPPSLAFDHVGIIVDSIEDGAADLARVLPLTAWTTVFHDTVLGVSVCFGRDASGVVYELIQPLGPDSPVARAARTKRDRLNQLAYRTADLASAREHLEASGAMVLGEPRPALAFGGAQVQFLFLPQGFILELIESLDFRHTFVSATPPGAA
jgi:methylmalonyl-CoA/ethylmalonyl-CoA epimerase